MKELKELYELQKEHIKVLQERIEILKHSIEIDKITIRTQEDSELIFKALLVYKNSIKRRGYDSNESKKQYNNLINKIDNEIKTFALI